MIFLLWINFNSFGAYSNSFGANSNSFGANYISFGANIFGANSNSFGANFNSFGANYNSFRANYIYFGANFIYFEANINLNSNTPRKLCRSLRWSLFIYVEVRQALGKCKYCCHQLVISVTNTKLAVIRQKKVNHIGNILISNIAQTYTFKSYLFDKCSHSSGMTKKINLNKTPFIEENIMQPSNLDQKS